MTSALPHLLTLCCIYVVCEGLRKIAITRGITREELVVCKAKREAHYKHIRELRMLYHRDWTRSLTDPKFQVITFDGADQAKTRVPQEWRKNVHGEYVSNSALVQKLQSVLMHGKGIRFYVIPPFISKGMDCTVLTIVHSLWELPPSVEEIRLQFDGGSENVNYAVQTLCGLLVEYGVFKNVYANRLPVG